MKTQNMILTSVLALVIASPAMAAVGDLVTDGAQCTIGDLGVSSGTANATAQFEINTYECGSGYYLPADGIACASCTAGNVCLGYQEMNGGSPYEYNEDDAQGIVSCAEIGGSNEWTSDAGAGFDENMVPECYLPQTCPTISATTACDPHAATCAYTNDAVTTGHYTLDGNSTLLCSLDFTCGTGYTKSTSQTAPTLPTTATNGNAYRSHSLDNTRYCSNTGCTNSSGLSGANLEAYNSMSTGEWAVDWTSGATQGTMKGIASCNNVPGNNSNNWAAGDSLPANSNLASTETTGRYCWCKPTSWTPSGGSEQSLSAAWVFLYADRDASDCANLCAYDCAINVYSSADFRSALFGVVGASPQCVANNITLSWNNENGTQFTSGSCTYDESLTVPSTHPDKRGYTFTGWKFVSPSQN